MLAGMRYLLTAKRFEADTGIRSAPPSVRPGDAVAQVLLEWNRTVLGSRDAANAHWTPHSGRGVWFVPRWRQTPFLRGGAAPWSRPSTRPPPIRSAQTVMR